MLRKDMVSITSSDTPENKVKKTQVIPFRRSKGRKKEKFFSIVIRFEFRNTVPGRRVENGGNRRKLNVDRRYKEALLGLPGNWNRHFLPFESSCR